MPLFVRRACFRFFQSREQIKVSSLERLISLWSMAGRGVHVPHREDPQLVAMGIPEPCAADSHFFSGEGFWGLQAQLYFWSRPGRTEALGPQCGVWCCGAHADGFPPVTCPAGTLGPSCVDFGARLLQLLGLWVPVSVRSGRGIAPLQP